MIRDPAAAAVRREASHGTDEFYRERARITQRRERRLERAIGVVYRPGTERVSHWFEAWLGRQFDAVVHLDETRAETFPTAL